MYQLMLIWKRTLERLEVAEVYQPERDERVTHFAANDVNSAVRDRKALKESAYVQRIRGPRQILQPYDNAHGDDQLNRFEFYPAPAPAFRCTSLVTSRSDEEFTHDASDVDLEERRKNDEKG